MEKILKRKRDDEEMSLMEWMKTRRLMSTDADDDNIPYIRSVKEQKKQKKKITMKKRRAISIRSPLSIKRKKRNSLIRSIVSIYEQDEKKKMEEQEKKKDLPVFELSHQYYRAEDYVESDEELLGDDVRGEDCRGYKYVIDETKLTYTRVKVPMKIYFTNHSVLHDEDYPVPTVTKLALDRYNAIEGTDYKYVGLVKAYASSARMTNHTVRFQACLPHQHPIYFQAIIIERLPNTANEVPVEVVLVHPLPS